MTQGKQQKKAPKLLKSNAGKFQFGMLQKQVIDSFLIYIISMLFKT